MTIIGPISPMEPGGELNLKAKRRWESLRRREDYRRDWDAAFTRMVEMLKLSPGPLGAEDLGCEPDLEKIREAIAKLEKAGAWKNFLEEKFQRDWPPAKLKEEFLYSQYVTEGRELADKYGLTVAYHYDDPLWDPYKKRMKHVFKDMWPIRIITQNPTSYKLSPDRKTVIADHTPQLRDGRFLTVEIDLYEKLGTIKKLINSQLDFYQNILNLPKAKKRDSALDFYLDTENGKVSIYELWDMSKRDGKTAWKITQELNPIATKGKNYQGHNNEVRSLWKQIDEAIKRAEKEIKDKEINPTF